MANFKQALDWLNEGKKVRLSGWGVKRYIFKCEEDIYDDEGYVDRIDFSNVFNTDWELYEEKPKHFSKTEDQQMIELGRLLIQVIKDNFGKQAGE